MGRLGRGGEGGPRALLSAPAGSPLKRRLSSGPLGNPSAGPVNLPDAAPATSLARATATALPGSLCPPPAPPPPPIPASIPAAAQEASSAVQRGPAARPLNCPRGPVQWCRDQDRPPWAGRAGEAAGTPHRHPCRRPGRRLPGCACPRVWPRRPRPGSGEPRAGPRRGAFGTHGMERERRGRVGVACVLENGTVCSPPVPRCPAAAWPASSWFPARPAPDRLCPLQALSPLLSRFRSWAHGGAGRTGTGPGRCHRVFP